MVCYRDADWCRALRRQLCSNGSLILIHNESRMSKYRASCLCISVGTIRAPCYSPPLNTSIMNDAPSLKPLLNAVSISITASLPFLSR